MAIVIVALDHQQIAIPIIIVIQLFLKRVLDNNNWDKQIHCEAYTG